MPPRIRSPTPSDEEDQLVDSPPPAPVPQSLPSLPPLTGPTRIKIKPPLPPPPPPAPAPAPLPTSELSETGAGSKRAGRGQKNKTYYDDYDEQEDELDEEDELMDSEPDLDGGEDSDMSDDYGSSKKKQKKGKATTAGGSRKSGRKSTGSTANAPSRKGTRRSSAANSTIGAVGEGEGGSGTGMKIKFKLGGTGASTAPPSSTAGSAGSTKGKGKTGSKGGAKGKGKGKGKKKADSEDESEVSFGSDSDDLPDSYLEPDDDPHGLGGGGDVDELDDQLRSDGYSSAGSQGSDGASSSAAGSSIYGGRKTARQRAKEMGGDEALELMSLPNRVYNKPAPPILTAEEIALQKAEKSRKRKHQADKKLEDEKTETINRLLKKQVGKAPSTNPTSKKAGKSKLSKSINADGSEEGGDGEGEGIEEIGRQEEEVKVFVKPSVARWVSSIKSGEFAYTYSVPEGRELVGDGGKKVEEKSRVREPPKKRLFTEQEKEEQRKLNRMGWERVMLGVA